MPPLPSRRVAASFVSWFARKMIERPPDFCTITLHATDRAPLRAAAAQRRRSGRADDAAAQAVAAPSHRVVPGRWPAQRGACARACRSGGCRHAVPRRPGAAGSRRAPRRCAPRHRFRQRVVAAALVAIAARRVDLVGADDDKAAPTDRPLAEARELLLRSVRQEAPVAGALTLMKLRRATSREDLEALLDEVEQRLRKPHRQIIAAQTLRHVRHLLGLPTASRPS